MFRTLLIKLNIFIINLNPHSKCILINFLLNTSYFLLFKFVCFLMVTITFGSVILVMLFWDIKLTHIAFLLPNNVPTDPRLSSCISLLWLQHVESAHQSMCVLHLTGPRPWTSCPYCALVKDNQISHSNKPCLDFSWCM